MTATTSSNEDNRISALLASGQVDLEITTSRAIGTYVLWHPLVTDDLHLALPQEHPLARGGGAGEPVRLERCRNDRFVLLRAPSRLRRMAMELLGAAGVDPDVAFEAEDPATVRGFVGHGLGISILPSLGAAVGRIGTDGVMLRPIADPGASRQLGMAWTTTHPLLPSADLFRQFVIDWATDPCR